jgi:hypothetical protein
MQNKDWNSIRPSWSSIICHGKASFVSHKIPLASGKGIFLPVTFSFDYNPEA